MSRLNPFKPKYIVCLVNRNYDKFELVKAIKVKPLTTIVRFEGRTFVLDTTKPTYTSTYKRYIFVDMKSNAQITLKSKEEIAHIEELKIKKQELIKQRKENMKKKVLALLNKEIIKTDEAIVKLDQDSKATDSQLSFPELDGILDARSIDKIIKQNVISEFTSSIKEHDNLIRIANLILGLVIGALLMYLVFSLIWGF